MSKLKNEEVQNFINGDDSIFPKVFVTYRNKINYLAYEILHNEADCEEVVQNTFILVIAKRAELRDSKAFNSWIYRIAYNASLDIYRRNKRRTTNSTQYDIESHLDRKGDTDDVLRKKEIREAIQAQIDELPEESRQLAILRFVGECSIEEIAKIMNIPEGTVKSRLHRTKIKLREGLSLKNVTPATYLSFMFTPLTFKLYSSLVKYQSMSSSSEMKTMKSIEAATGISAIGTATVGTAWLMSAGFGVVIAISSITAGGFGIYTALNPLSEPVSAEVVEMTSIDYLQDITNKNLQVVLAFSGEVKTEDIEIKLMDKMIQPTSINLENYMFIAEVNGTYKVKYRNIERDVVIDNIDKQGPVLNEITKQDGLLMIKGSDDFSGVDFEKSYLQEGEKKISLIPIDGSFAYFTDAIVEKANLRLYDKSGNYQTYEILATEVEQKE